MGDAFELLVEYGIHLMLSLTTTFNHALFTQILQAILRTTGPSPGLLVLILMYFAYRFQIWT